MIRAARGKSEADITRARIYKQEGRINEYRVFRVSRNSALDISEKRSGGKTRKLSIKREKKERFIRSNNSSCGSDNDSDDDDDNNDNCDNGRDINYNDNNPTTTTITA